MLQSVELTNFKCFQKQAFHFSSLTVLAGLNGMGKSSLLQSLLLLRQSNGEFGLKQGLKLNGAYVSLGSALDVLYEKSETDSLSIAIQENDQLDRYQFSCADSYSDSLPLEEHHGAVGKDSILFSNHFAYLSAYRIAPLPIYRITNEANLEHRDFGVNGEFVIHYLKQYGDETVPCAEMLRGSTENRSLNLQVREWMNLVSPGVLPIINLNLQTRTAELGYEFIQGTEKSMTFKSTNVGFGITYVLPIVVTLLSAQKGDLVLIENPEAHIHPKGQRHLGELIARAASGGVQVLLETHSDHVLNGIRIAVRQRMLDAGAVTLSYFAHDSGNCRSQVICPRLLSSGQLDQWPEGFFDEWDNSLLELL